ncbi:hypothetical protein AAK979_02595 [Ileibacterium valens]|uniref:hypothetical protein n=1 Tax=Ileibacterium valens TaxID=1862668 RepID=UPI0035176BAD
MNTDTQSIRGQQILTALITIFEKHNNQATLEQIYEEVPEFMMEEVEQSDIIQVLRSYTSNTIACEPEPGKIACIFVDLGDGNYELIADDESLRAYKGQKGSYVDPALVSANGLAEISAESDPYIADAVIDSDNAAKENKKAARAAARADMILDSDRADCSQEKPDNTSWTYPEGTDYVKPNPENKLSDETYVIENPDRDQVTVEDSDSSMFQNAADPKTGMNQDIPREPNESIRSDVQELIEHNEEVIRDKKARIEEHEEQIQRDSMDFMKTIHQMEIDHDERVIDGKQKENDELKLSQDR